MSNIVDIDEVDEKILHILIRDVRTNLKEIAKQCGLSSVTITNRIKRLKKLGVITGATLFTPIEEYGFEFVATIGMETNASTDEILAMFGRHATLIEPSSSVGEYDLCALVYAESLRALNEKLEAIKRRFRINKVTVHVWSGAPQFNLANIDLTPTKGKQKWTG